MRALARRGAARRRGQRARVVATPTRARAHLSPAQRAPHSPCAAPPARRLHSMLQPVRDHFARGEPKKLLEAVRSFKVTR
jgi:hypothetical protein